MVVVVMVVVPMTWQGPQATRVPDTPDWDRDVIVGDDDHDVGRAVIGSQLSRGRNVRIPKQRMRGRRCLRVGRSHKRVGGTVTMR